MALPELTEQERAAALEKAAIARRERAAVKNRLKYSQGSLAEVISEGRTNDIVGKMKVSLDGKPHGEFPVVALEAVPVAGIFGRAIDTMRLWFN